MEKNDKDQQNEPEIGEVRFSSSILNIGFPTCIMRTPGSDVEQSAQTWTSMFTSKDHRIPTIQNREEEPIEKQDGVSGGLLNNRDFLHVLKDDEQPNVYTHRLSYNTFTNAYYENGNFDKEYLKTWKRGVLSSKNIYYKMEYDWDRVYLARDPNERKDVHGEICWKFDYRLGNFVISKLSLKLQHTIFDHDASVVWTIGALPSRTNVDPILHTIEFEPISSYPHNVDSRKDVTSLVEGQYGFVICATLSGGLHADIPWQRAQLFRRSTVEEFDKDLGSNFVDDDSGMNFGLDVNVELIPDLICESLPEVKYIKEGKGNELVFNDEETSDFVVHLKIPGDSGEDDDDPFNKKILKFYVHRNVLSARSDYFKAMLNSQMVESRENLVTLSGISSSSFETILKFIYTGTLPDINSYEEWVELLHSSSRFLIPALVQRCEEGIREYLNNESVETIEAVAKECGANQLLRCCEMLNHEEER